MDYTFECGACHAIYKLDEKQITLKGVKITCPKCLSYFILKKGTNISTNIEAAYIEYVAEDGPVEIQPKKTPKLPEKEFFPDEKTDKIEQSVTTAKIPIKKSAEKKPSKHYMDRQYVTPYVPSRKKSNKALQYIFWICCIVAALYFLYWKVL